jgi:predicted molibdopterin-dependent oxidoreductase YjgC
VFSGYQAVTDKNVVKTMETAWNVAGIPSRIGDTVTAMLPRAFEGSLKCLYVVGENPMLSDPDLNHTEKCLKNLEFMVVQDIFMTETARLAHVVLPSACFAEKEGTFTNTERRVQRIRRAVNPPGEVKADWEIISRLAIRMGYPMAYEKSEEIFDEMAAITPSYRGINYTRIENEEIHWPCPSLDHPGTPILHTEQFTCGKGKFHAVEFIAPAEVPDKDYPLYLTTGRILYQYHTGTMTMKSNDLNSMAPECYVEISLEDAQQYGVAADSRLRVTSRRGEITAVARVSDKVPPGTLFIPFHYAGAAANRLTNAALDPVCKIPELKVCAVNILPER